MVDTGEGCEWACRVSCSSDGRVRCCVGSNTDRCLGDCVHSSRSCRWPVQQHSHGQSLAKPARPICTLWTFKSETQDIIPTPLCRTGLIRVNRLLQPYCDQYFSSCLLYWVLLLFFISIVTATFCMMTNFIDWLIDLLQIAEHWWNVTVYNCEGVEETAECAWQQFIWRLTSSSYFGLLLACSLLAVCVFCCV